jgi:hypothetical protein
MMSPTRTEPLCPRCYAPLDPGAQGCARCGAAILRRGAQSAARADGAYCPRCDRLEEAGGSFVGETVHGTDEVCDHCGTGLVTDPSPKSAPYEERSIATPSYDLDRLARAEAVDGWALVDTTIDPRSPHRVLAHFRRGLPPDDPRAKALRTPAAPAHAATRARIEQARPQPARPAPKAAPAPRRAPAPSPPRRAARRGWTMAPAFTAAMITMAIRLAIVLVRQVAIPLALAVASLLREIIIAMSHSVSVPRSPRRFHRRHHRDW